MINNEISNNNNLLAKSFIINKNKESNSNLDLSFKDIHFRKSSKLRHSNKNPVIFNKKKSKKITPIQIEKISYNNYYTLIHMNSNNPKLKNKK